MTIVNILIDCDNYSLMSIVNASIDYNITL